MPCRRASTHRSTAVAFRVSFRGKGENPGFQIAINNKYCLARFIDVYLLAHIIDDAARNIESNMHGGDAFGFYVARERRTALAHVVLCRHRREGGRPDVHFGC